jgi:RNase adaptor protein for sRNA GlmZ degradation
MFPFLVTHELHDEVIEERRSLVDVNVNLSNDVFTIPPNTQNLHHQIKNKKLERKIEMIFMPLHERMHKILSSYSDSELTFLLDTMTELIEQTREESKRLRSLKKKSPLAA